MGLHQPTLTIVELDHLLVLVTEIDTYRLY